MMGPGMKAMRWARGLFFLNAAIWLVFGVVSVVRLGGNEGQGVTALVVAILMFGNAAAMALSGALLVKRRWLFYFFALVVLAVNIVLTFTDQVGALDLITLVIDLVLLWILVVARKQFIYGES
jgi:positive regulator of sigma E activity